MLKVINQLQWE